MKATTFLMFTGQAEEAMHSYIALFPRSRILDLKRYGPEAPGREGSVYQARFEINGQELMCIDSPAVHAFTFTPATSLFVDCDDEAQLQTLFGALGQGGTVLMPLDAYPFSRKYAWLQDRFGVSWQLNLP